MIEVEHLDIRTTTLSLSLLDIAGADEGVADRVYQRITEAGQNLVQVADEVGSDLGVPIINKRIEKCVDVPQVETQEKAYCSQEAVQHKKPL